MVHWSSLVPNLPVRDVPASQAWCLDTLGMRVNWLWEDNFGSVGKDHVELFLYESDEPRPVICSLFLDDVDAIHERCRERGADVCSELELKPWNVREYSVRDPDGNMLRIGASLDEAPAPELSLDTGVERG